MNHPTLTMTDLLNFRIQGENSSGADCYTVRSVRIAVVFLAAVAQSGKSEQNDRRSLRDITILARESHQALVNVYSL
jgi:hypothetical protein